MLIGADDGAFEDRGRLHVTVHHNWWSDYLRERMPRVRFGPVHVFNNYCVGRMDETAYGVGAGFEASVLVKNNFDNFWHPHEFMDGTSTADLFATGNQYVGVSDYTLRETRGAAFTPPYPYTVGPVTDVPALVQAGAGSG